MFLAYYQFAEFALPGAIARERTGQFKQTKKTACQVAGGCCGPVVFALG
jgi:hypothetical protein